MVCVIRPSTVIKELPEELLLDPCTNDLLYHEILHFRVSNETVEADNRATVEVQAALQADLTASGYVFLRFPPIPLYNHLWLISFRIFVEIPDKYSECICSCCSLV